MSGLSRCSGCFFLVGGSWDVRDFQLPFLRCRLCTCLLEAAPHPIFGLLAVHCGQTSCRRHLIIPHTVILGPAGCGSCPVRRTCPSSAPFTVGIEVNLTSQLCSYSRLLFCLWSIPGRGGYRALQRLRR